MSEAPEMNPERWQRIQKLFDHAIDLNTEAQRAFLNQLASEDTALYEEVTELIRADQAAGTFLGKEAAEKVAPLLVEMDPDEPEEQHVGAYRIVSRIGRGGMGSVYLAERDDGQFQQQVALKIIRRGLDTDDILSRFLYERQILASLDHPNIARLYDGGITEDGRPYFVMEYVDGLPIDTYCDANRLTPHQRLDLFRTACRAVQYAHQNMVIHRDLKPSNILVTQDGEVKLLDFGIAKLLDDEGMPMTRPMTSQGVRLMTPEYASPEQVRGANITTASDVYALGVLLYELLTGRRPYQITERVQHEIERIILEEEPTRPSTAIRRATQSTKGDVKTAETGPSISETRSTSISRLKKMLMGDLDNIILKALQKTPDRRYSTVDQFANDILNYLDGLPVSAHRDSVGYRVSKFVRRHKIGVAATSVIAVLAVVVFVFSVVTASQARKLAEERDRVALEAEKSERVKDFLISIFNVADPGQTEGKEVTAGEILEQAVERIGEELAEQPLLQAELLDAMGEVYISLSQFDDASALYENALELKHQAIEEDDHPELAYTLHQLAVLNYFKGNYVVSEAAHQDVLAMRQRIYNGDHPDVVLSLSEVGTSQWGQGKYDEASATILEAVEMAKRLPDVDLESIAQNQKYLGVIASSQGKYAEAENYLRDALLGFLEAEDVDVQWVPNTQSDLAMVLAYQGSYNEAEAIMRESIATYRTIYGEKHGNVAALLSNLSIILSYKQDHAGAERIMRESLAIRRELFGDASAQVANSLHNLGSVIDLQNRPAEAEPFVREALAIRRKLYGNVHPQVQSTLSSFCSILVKQQSFSEAEACFIESYDMGVQFMDSTHVAMLAERMAWAEMYTQWGRYGEADALFEEVVPQSLKALGEEHRVTGRLKASWGSCLLRQERYVEAEPLLLAGYTVHMETRGAENRFTKATRADLATLYEALGQPNKAAEYEVANANADG